MTRGAVPRRPNAEGGKKDDREEHIKVDPKMHSHRLSYLSFSLTSILFSHVFFSPPSFPVKSYARILRNLIGEPTIESMTQNDENSHEIDPLWTTTRSFSIFLVRSSLSSTISNHEIQKGKTHTISMIKITVD